jgi:monofunctional biosynthetic peptidoglycan transglycosylase
MTKGRGVMRLIRFVVRALVGLYVCCLLLLLGLRWINPPTTALQIQRRVQSWFKDGHYRKRQQYAPLRRISPNLQHAVIAAEDGRFYQHHGIDWKEVQKVVDKDLDDGKVGRGASTITQQLVKNLFLGTTRSFIRKGAEFALTYPTELILGKERILELYLNVIEWGPGVYGAEQAAQFWYNSSAARLSRDQSARLAAVIPSPPRRRPSRMDSYNSEILHRMEQTGW